MARHVINDKQMARHVIKDIQKHVGHAMKDKQEIRLVNKRWTINRLR